jgi:FtsZ-binding cell division protein ZapB
MKDKAREDLKELLVELSVEVRNLKREKEKLEKELTDAKDQAEMWYRRYYDKVVSRKQNKNIQG